MDLLCKKCRWVFIEGNCLEAMPNGGGVGLTQLQATGATPATEADEDLDLPACEHRVRCPTCQQGGEALYCTVGCECDRQLVYPRPDGQPPLCWECQLNGHGA